MTVRRIDVGAVTLAVREAGAGGRPLLLVHGFTGAKEDFTELVEPLASDGWHAVAPDLRGHGASDQPPDQDAYDLAIFTADVLALADQLGWGRFALVGHSMGGAIAQRIVLDHPDRVTGLVLMSTFHGPLTVDPNLVALGVAIVSSGGMSALAAALAARRSNDPAAQAARARMERARPGYSAWSDTKLKSCAAAMWLAMAPRFPAWPDTIDELVAVTAPTLVVVGSDDETMRAQCESLAATVPGARLAIIEGTRHSPQIEAPQTTLAAVGSFLDQTVGPPHEQGAQPMSNTVARVIEISAISSVSFEDAVKTGVARANRTLRNVTSAWVKEQRVEVNNGAIATYQVNLMVTFILDEDAISGSVDG